MGPTYFWFQWQIAEIEPQVNTLFREKLSALYQKLKTASCEHLTKGVKW
jgi:hypothetical protein